MDVLTLPVEGRASACPAPVRRFVPLHRGQAVTVAFGGSEWAGEVTRVGLFDTSPVAVVCTDPWKCRDVVRGQWFVVPHADVTPVFRPGRWGRC